MDTEGLAASAKALAAAGWKTGQRVDVGPRTFETMYAWAVQRQPFENREMVAQQLQQGKLAVTYCGYIARPLKGVPEWRMYPPIAKRRNRGTESGSTEAYCSNNRHPSGR